MPIPDQTPAEARARAVLRDPASVDCHPALLGGAWVTLKHLRGQTVRPHRLTPAFDIDRAVRAAPRRAATMPPRDGALICGDVA